MIEELISLYHPDDLIPLIELLENLNESTIVNIQELVKTRVYTEWLLGLNVAMLVLLIVIVFSTFFSNYSR